MNFKYRRISTIVQRLPFALYPDAPALYIFLHSLSPSLATGLHMHIFPELSGGKGETSCFFTHKYFYLFIYSFLGLHLWHMEVPRLRVPSELQLPAYTTATATPDPSRVFDLHHSSQQYRILNPLRGSRDQTHNLMVANRIHFCCATTQELP